MRGRGESLQLVCVEENCLVTRAHAGVLLVLLPFIRVAGGRARPLQRNLEEIPHSDHLVVAA